MAKNKQVTRLTPNNLLMAIRLSKKCLVIHLIVAIEVSQFVVLVWLEFCALNEMSSKNLASDYRVSQSSLERKSELESREDF